MKRYLFAVPLACAIAAPAHATAGSFCTTGGADPIEVSLVISRTIGGALISAALSEKGKEIETSIAQWWVDRSEMRLLLTDTNAEREEVEIRARARGDYYVGTLKRNGRSYRVRCEESG